MYRYASTCQKDPVSRSHSRGRDRLSQEAIRKDSNERRGRLTTEDGIRHDLVARVKREIAAGTYDTPEKLAIALERMFS